MRFNQLTVLVYATAASAAPAFTWPDLSSGSNINLFDPSTWFPASSSPAPAASASASALPIKVPTASTSDIPSVPSASPLPSAVVVAAPAGSSAAASAPQTDCTYQGAGGGSTEDGIKNVYCCTDVTIVYARGTTEPGNVGYSTGPSFFKALRNMLGTSKVTVQGTEYEATWDSIASGGGKGPAQMASDVKTILGRCPNTKVVLSGYSQGGMVVHNSITTGGLTGSEAKAAVLFGDPYNGQGVGNLPSSQIKEFCASGDDVCDGSHGFGTSPAHQTYPNNAEDAATFVAQALGL